MQNSIDLSQISLVHVINRYIEVYPAPYHGLIIDVSKEPDSLGVWSIYNYKENTHEFSDRQREEMWLWLKGLVDFLNANTSGAVQIVERDKVPQK